LNPVHTLARGYAVARDANGAVIVDAGALAAGQQVSVQFAHGAIDASVLAIRPG
jgi:exodeoxyribonuclease VII large subunit